MERARDDGKWKLDGVRAYAYVVEGVCAEHVYTRGAIESKFKRRKRVTYFTRVGVATPLSLLLIQFQCDQRLVSRQHG